MSKVFYIALILAIIAGYGYKSYTPFLTIMGTYIIGRWIFNVFTHNPA
jgi:hypothetical protein